MSTTEAEVVYGEITTGVESDLQQLSQIAREMVGRWGMSDKLTEHRAELDNLAHALLKAETRDGPAAYAAAGISRDADPQVAAAV
ncbi:MAG: hypothetical protein JO363_23610 [Solirubrobacterales bacterium]|nr:hypothetical protein [Solirubrobacterales bacterium]